MTWLESITGWKANIFAADYLPLTVTVAIVLFAMKELLEIRRRRAERRRKTKAIKLLLSQELERNHFALDSLFYVLRTLREALEDAPRAVFHLYLARNGSEHFRMKKEPEKEDELSLWIPSFSTILYEKLLASLAEYDQDLYKVVNKTYIEIIELIHYRERLTSFLAGEDIAPKGMTRQFLTDFTGEEHHYYEALNEAYKALTGEDFKNKYVSLVDYDM